MIITKYIILDTNLLSYLESHPLLEKFSEIFREKNYLPLITEEVNFEYLRNVFEKDFLITKTAFLSQITDGVLPHYTNQNKIALRLAQLIKEKYPKNNCSIVDIYLGSYLYKYRKSEVYVATANNKDFGINIYDRCDLILVHREDLDLIVTLGLYKLKKSTIEELDKV